jgi:isocitrate lyase
VLVGVDEQIKRLSAARFQLDIMKVPGIVVARTDAEAATFLEGAGTSAIIRSSWAPPTSSCRPTRSATSPS